MPEITFPWADRQQWRRVKSSMRAAPTNYPSVDTMIHFFDGQPARHIFATSMFNYHRSALSELEGDVLGRILPRAQAAVLLGPKLFNRRLQVLNSNKAYKLTRRQVFTLMSCALFGLIGNEHSLLEFFETSNVTAMVALLRYFAIAPADDSLIVVRRSTSTDDLNIGHEFIENCRIVPNAHYTSSPASVYIVSADKLGYTHGSGGAVLAFNSIYLESPELLIAPILCGGNIISSVVSVTGAQQFNAVNVKTGHAEPATDTSRAACDGTFARTVVFASPYKETNNFTEFTRGFDQDLQTQHLAMSVPRVDSELVVSIGMWGQEHNANKYLKLIQTVIASAVQSRTVLIHVGDDRAFSIQALQFLQRLRDEQITARDLYKMYNVYRADVQHRVINNCIGDIMRGNIFRVILAKSTD